MPFKSEAQRRLFWAKVGRGEIERPVAEEWERATKRKKLPERVKHAFLDELKKISAEFAPGLPEKGKVTPLPEVKKPQTWEFSAHPHEAERAGYHIDLRLGNPETGIAHSFVLPKGKLPEPGKSQLLIPTSDHTVKYQDFTGPITEGYGKGRVVPGRRTKVDVYHAISGDAPGTKVRFNLYDADHPQEYAIVQDQKGRHLLVNKTLTRERRPDIPGFKPKYKETNIEKVDPANAAQVLMPKLDGAHTLIDLEAGRAPRLFSYRVGKKTETGLIEHTHKVPQLLETKVPKALDGTILRAETVAVDAKGKQLPLQELGGILNSKVWQSREKQDQAGTRLKVFPFSVERYQGKDVSGMSWNKQQSIMERIHKLLPDLGRIPVASSVAEKVRLLNEVKAGKNPLTDEGVVAATPHAEPLQFTKAKINPDFDVFVRGVVANRKHPDRAGAIQYSWTPEGPIMGTIGGFKHQEARDMLQNPDKYIGRVAKAQADSVFSKGDALGALRQGRFKEWHLDKGDIEKNSNEREAFFRSLRRPALRALREGAEYSEDVLRIAQRNQWGPFKRKADQPSKPSSS